jgi:hypothetical protein
VKGSLLGAQQDAVMKLDDFPMAMLQPIFRAVPALQHAAPAVAAPGSSPPAAELLTRMNIPFLKCARPLPASLRFGEPPAAANACNCGLI